MTMKLTIKQLMEYAEKQKVFAMTPLSTLTELVRQQIIAKIQFEVETDIDALQGCDGYYFNDLTEAYNYLSDLLKLQTDPEAFECDDFEKIDSVCLYLHFDYDEAEIITIANYERKSDTEFIERIYTTY